MTLQPELYRAALRRETLEPLHWQTGSRTSKHMQRALRITSAGGVLLGSGESALTWLPYGHAILLELISSQNSAKRAARSDEVLAAKRAHVAEHGGRSLFG
jgi:hypothetical protein